MSSIPELPLSTIQGVEWRPHGQAVLKSLQRRQVWDFLADRATQGDKERDPAVEKSLCLE